METEPILKKTLVTVAAMVGACVAFVGTLAIAAVVVTSHAVNPGGAQDDSSTLVPADKINHPGGAQGPAGAPKPPTAPSSKSRVNI